jgi:hypothetical protein
LAEIQLESDVQVRTRVDPVKVSEYASLMESEDRLPPVVVFRDGGRYLLADGFHRVAAALRINRLEIAADVREGSVRDAHLHALRANTTRGLPLTRDEKRRAALLLLQDPEWKDWSDREIARHCGLCGMTIARLRSRDDHHKVKVTSRKFRDRNGHVRTMNVERMGRKRRSSEEEPVDAGRSMARSAGPEGVTEAVGALLRHTCWLLEVPRAVAAFVESNRRDASLLRRELVRLLELLDRISGRAPRGGRRQVGPTTGSHASRNRHQVKSPHKTRRHAAV